MHSEIESITVTAMLYTRESCMHAAVRALHSSAFIFQTNCLILWLTVTWVKCLGRSLGGSLVVSRPETEPNDMKNSSRCWVTPQRKERRLQNYLPVFLLLYLKTDARPVCEWLVCKNVSLVPRPHPQKEERVWGHWCWFLVLQAQQTRPLANWLFKNSSQVDIVDLHSCPDDDRSMVIVFIIER